MGFQEASTLQEDPLRPEDAMLWTLSWSPHPELPSDTQEMLDF